MVKPTRWQPRVPDGPEQPFAGVELVFLNASETYPNNEALPLILYSGAIDPGLEDMTTRLQELFTGNGWTGCWVDGIYDFHHYHSTAHEVLGISRGTACVQFGGPDGHKAQIQAGDVVLVPAGVAHKCLDASVDFEVVGAYPEGQRPDMCYGRADERPVADQRIRSVSLPERDPVQGQTGPVGRFWRP